MSPCEKYQELISRMVDGELTAREEADLADHIESCTACAALFRAFSAISEQIGGDLEEAPLDLRENVMAEIRREEIRKKNRIPTIFRAVMSTAACAAIVFGVYLGVTLTKKAQISTAAYQDAPAAAEERMVLAAESAPEALETEEAAEEALPEEEPAPTPMPDAAPAEAAEEPAAPMLGAGAAAAADEPKEADADNVAAFDAKLPADPAGVEGTQNGQPGERADDDGVHEDLEDAIETLLDRIGLGSCGMRDRSGA